MVALQILNLDIYIHDHDEVASVASTNADADDETDSVVEYISEVIVKKIKSIHSNNKKPNRHLQAHKHSGLKMIELQKPQFDLTKAAFEEVKASSFVKNYYYQFCKEINPPPPKA